MTKRYLRYWLFPVNLPQGSDTGFKILEIYAQLVEVIDLRNTVTTLVLREATGTETEKYIRAGRFLAVRVIHNILMVSGTSGEGRPLKNLASVVSLSLYREKNGKHIITRRHCHRHGPRYRRIWKPYPSPSVVPPTFAKWDGHAVPDAPGFACSPRPIVTVRVMTELKVTLENGSI